MKNCSSKISGKDKTVTSINLNTLNLYAFFATCILVVQPASGETDFDTSIETGFTYDSNVTVNEIDQSTTESDSLWYIDIGASIDSKVSETTDISVSYDFSQTKQNQFSDFDIQMHNLIAGISQDFKKITVDLNGIYAYSMLGGEHFLTLERISPAISGFIGRKWFLRGQYDHSTKDFPGRTSRNAETDSLGGTLYYFANGTQSYLSLTYSYREEDAQDNQYDYYADNIRLNINRDFTVSTLKLESQLSLRYDKRQYTRFDTGIDDYRSDDRYSMDIEFLAPFANHWYTILEIGYDNFQSNFVAADYDQFSVGIGIGAEF